MEQRYLHIEEGVCYANIDITVNEWKIMLKDNGIFDERSLKMIQYWYEQLDHQATSKEIMKQYSLTALQSPFNGIVVGLGKRIVKFLNRFEILDHNGSKCYYILPFEGWRENYKAKGSYVWKLRKELVQAIEELELFEETKAASRDELLENYNIEVSTAEGTKKAHYVTKYERNPKNRRLAILLHGTKCCICDFDFEKVYGERGRGFIEVHHIKPLYNLQEEVAVDPKTDLICVCSNCHRMFHRKKDYVPSPEELKSIVAKSKRRS